MPRERKSKQVYDLMTDAQFSALHNVCYGLLDSGKGKWLVSGKGCSSTIARKLEEYGCAKVQEVEGESRVLVKPTAFGRKVHHENIYAD